MKIYEHLWKSMNIYENLWKSMKIHDNQWRSVKIHENLWKSMKINKNQWKSIEQSMKINGNLWRSMKFMTYMGCICFKQRRWVIFYVLNIYTPHTSALQRQINCLNRENGNWCFQDGLWPANYKSKSLFLWKPEMIPRSLRSFCPKRFPVKPR